MQKIGHGEAQGPGQETGKIAQAAKEKFKKAYYQAESAFNKLKGLMEKSNGETKKGE